MSVISRDSWLTFFTCLVLGLFVFIDTLRYPDVQGQGFGQGPAFYPQLLAGILIILGAIITLQDTMRKKQPIVPHDKPLKSPVRPRYAPVAMMMTLTIILVILMKYLGFYLSGFLLTILTVLMIRGSVKGRHLVMDLLFSIGIIILAYLVFAVFVGVDLPSSIIFN